MTPKMKIQVSRYEGMDTFISQLKLHLKRCISIPTFFNPGCWIYDEDSEKNKIRNTPYMM